MRLARTTGTLAAACLLAACAQGTGDSEETSDASFDSDADLSGTVQVIVAGRLAASGDYRKIRRLMTHRPHVFAVHSSDDRRLAVALMRQPSVAGVELDRAGLTVRAGDYGSFTRALPKVALAEGVRVQRLLPSDESLESVFSYLVEA